MSTRSHNFYGFQKINGFGETDPKVFCRFRTGGGNTIASGSTARIVFKVIEADPFHMAFQDNGSGPVGARVCASGRWRIRVSIYASQGSSTISSLYIYKASSPVYSVGGVIQTTGATSLLYAPQSSSGGQSTMIADITPALTNGDFIFVAVESSGGTTDLPTTASTAFFEMEYLSPDA